jgi:hypothetical protein
MQLSRKTLYASWARFGAAAVAAFIVLSLADNYLKARTGYGTVDLQGLSSGWAVRLVLDHWTSPPNAALAGFALGFDYLFMPLYATALFLGGVVACARFAPRPGTRRRIMSLVAMAPIAGAVFDACENALEMTMWIAGPTDTLAALALQATAGKYAGVVIGLVLSLLAAAGLLFKETETSP